MLLQSGAEGFGLVLISRFFPLQLFKKVHTFVRPGGWLIFSHFTDPQPGCRDYDSPPRDGRVQPGDVETILTNANGGWRIVQAAYSSSQDGRPMWDIVALYLGH